MFVHFSNDLGRTRIHCRLALLHHGLACYGLASPSMTFSLAAMFWGGWYFVLLPGGGGVGRFCRFWGIGQLCLFRCQHLPPTLTWPTFPTRQNFFRLFNESTHSFTTSITIFLTFLMCFCAGFWLIWHHLASLRFVWTVSWPTTHDLAATVVTTFSCICQDTNGTNMKHHDWFFSRFLNYRQHCQTIWNDRRFENCSAVCQPKLPDLCDNRFQNVDHIICRILAGTHFSIADGKSHVISPLRNQHLTYITSSLLDIHALTCKYMQWQQTLNQDILRYANISSWLMIVKSLQKYTIIKNQTYKIKILLILFLALLFSLMEELYWPAAVHGRWRGHLYWSRGF